MDAGAIVSISIAVALGACIVGVGRDITRAIDRQTELLLKEFRGQEARR